MNAERCLLAGEALGLGYAALKKYASNSLFLKVHMHGQTTDARADPPTTPANESSSLDPLVKIKQSSIPSQTPTCISKQLS